MDTIKLSSYLLQDRRSELHRFHSANEAYGIETYFKTDADAFLLIVHVDVQRFMPSYTSGLVSALMNEDDFSVIMYDQQNAHLRIGCRYEHQAREGVFYYSRIYIQEMQHVISHYVGVLEKVPQAWCN